MPRGVYPRIKPRRRTPLEARFWAKVVKNGDGCWSWTAGTDQHGYGRIGLGAKSDPIERAHRISWLLHRGPIPVGMCVLHRCDNPICTRPDHLFLGTRTDNAADKTAKGRAKGPRGIANKRAKLTDDSVATIYSLYLQGRTMASLARDFGVTPPAVRALARGWTWNQITGLPPIRRDGSARPL